MESPLKQTWLQQKQRALRETFIRIFDAPWPSLLLPPPVAENADKLRATLSKLILMRVLVLSVLLGTNTWALLVRGGGKASAKIVFGSIALIYIVSLLNALWLRASKQPRTCGYIQLVVDVLLATLAIYVTNSVVSISLYLLAIVGASLVLSLHGTLITAALSGLCYAALSSGLLPAIDGRQWTASTPDILAVYVSLVLVAFVSGYLARKLEHLGHLADSTAKTLDALNKQQTQLFNDISEGIITVDLNETITSINEAARAILGLTKLDHAVFLGRALGSVLDEHGISPEADLLKSTADNSATETIIHDKKQEHDIHISYSCKPLTDGEGNALGSMLIIDDVSHVRSIQERLDLHERMAKLLAETTGAPGGNGSALRDTRMVGESQVMKKVFSLVERVSTSDASVLITGESGTGKELIARAIHNNSNRRGRSFIGINCGAIPENLIESELFGHKKGSFTGAVADNPGLLRQAQGGTVFLDEIGELPLHLQTKLLRVLQERVVRAVGDTRDVSLDVRVIAATNRDLKKDIAAGRFREDLYYRINVVNIAIPPLRDRREDIPLLVHYFIARYCSKDQVLPQISPEALALLTSYSYPGNVRELENIIERTLVLGGHAILTEHLPEELIAAGAQQTAPRSLSLSDTAPGHEASIHVLPVSLEAVLEKLEKEYLHRAMTQSGGVKKHAAELLGLNFRSFRYRMKKYGLDEDADGEEHDASAN